MGIHQSAFAMLLVALAGFAAPAFARTCSTNTLTGRAIDATVLAILTRQLAVAAARRDWTNDCLAAFGDPWCNFSLSTQRRYSCTRVPNGIGGFDHTRTVTARPCRP